MSCFAATGGDVDNLMSHQFLSEGWIIVLKDCDEIYETGEVISVNVYKASQEHQIHDFYMFGIFLLALLTFIDKRK